MSDQDHRRGEHLIIWIISSPARILIAFVQRAGTRQYEFGSMASRRESRDTVMPPAGMLSTCNTVQGLIARYAGIMKLDRANL